jgi:hypothetical protein
MNWVCVIPIVVLILRFILRNCHWNGIPSKESIRQSFVTRSSAAVALNFHGKKREMFSRFNDWRMYDNVQ